MRKLALAVMLWGVILTGFAQPKINNVVFQAAVDQFSLYEIKFQLNDYGNPYDPEVIDVYAEFIDPQGRKRKVIGFYFEGFDFENKNGVEVAIPKKGDKGWRIRFTPDTAGPWEFTIHAVDVKGTAVYPKTGTTASFTCNSVNSADGFITMANHRYMKREVVDKGQKRFHSYFPIGPNLAWYSCTEEKTFQEPYGIYEYEPFIGSLEGNANYLRIWINKSQFLSLYGFEHATINGERLVMHFDSKINQKDAAELDYILNDASDHGISLMLSFFAARDFFHKKGISEGDGPFKARTSDWYNNPFNIVLGLKSPYQFFSDPEAKRITKNLLRYSVARWGYATNVMCWELWNEIGNIFNDDTAEERIQRDINTWHSEMSTYIRSIDPFRHPITTSLGAYKNMDVLVNGVFKDLDFTQLHVYQSPQNAKSSMTFSYSLLKVSNKYLGLYPTKPFFVGEFAFSQSNTKNQYSKRDPQGVDLHNTLWSSLFSGSMAPASFWFWSVIKKQRLYHVFKPILTFCEKLPVLSDSFTAVTTGSVEDGSLVFPNNLETYYLINASQDTILGWSQDDAFSYQSLRRLTDRVGSDMKFDDDGTFDEKGYVYTLDPAKRPKPSSRRNTISIPIENQNVGTRYRIRWFDAETGLEIESASTSVFVRRFWIFQKRLSFEFPSEIRDLETRTINNTLGDAVFMIYKVSK